MDKTNNTSAIYMIDADYNIVTFNEAAKLTYPQLERSKKCHKCLMNLDEPCSVCPVLNHVEGPQTYLDPIRKIQETVDAVPFFMQDGTTGYALVMSTVGEREEISRKLPTNAEDLNALLKQDLYDKLTGGYSRTGFIKEVSAYLGNHSDERFTLTQFDISNFKSINEVFGFEGGDHLIQAVYHRLHNSVLAPLYISRFEADRFVILTKQDEIDLEHIKDLLQMEWEYHGRKIHVDIRCGIYVIQENDPLSVSGMIDRAIVAKDYARNEGIRSYAIFDRSMHHEYIGRAEILTAFPDSLANHDFEIYYQPVIDAKSGNVSSAEALVRWNHPVLGFISPDRFIPVLEKNGLITDLDHYVLDEVYQFQLTRQKEGRPMIPVACNLSWQDFYDNEFMNAILLATKGNELQEGSLYFEVTETSFATLDQNCEYLIEQFRKAGSHVLLDDFGTGYSSFGMIRNYEFDFVKIDRSFIRQIEYNDKVRSIIISIIDMCHKIGLHAVGEGVETEFEYNFLKKHGCDYFQGYYYAKPLQKDKYVDYLQRNSWNEKNVETPNVKPLEKLHGDSIDETFLSDVLDNVQEIIQICNPDTYEMIYANGVTRAISNDPDGDYRGKKCYAYMLNLKEPCAHCPMNKMEGESEKIIEVDDGRNVFALKAKYMDWNGQRLFMEFGNDITASKQTEKRYQSQIASILESIPNEQGIFHLDVTADEWFSSAGNAQNARAIQDVQDVNTLVRMVGSYVPDEEGQEKFFQTFNRKALLDAFHKNRHEIKLDTLSYYDDRSIRWSRITARLIENPENHHLECILYGIDISKEMEELSDNSSLQEKYMEADHDRRTDYLTGLSSRMDLFEYLEQNEKPIRTMFLLDIDDFKDVNDQYGHQVGDQCLKVLGLALKKFGEEHDLYFYRYGGEEFLCIDAEEREDIHSLINTLLEMIRSLSYEDKDGESHSISISIGYTQKTSSYEKMIDYADQAMYIAKRTGKNCSVCYEKNK